MASTNSVLLGLFVAPEYRKEVKLRAVQAGVTMNEYVCAAVNEKMEKEREDEADKSPDQTN